MRHSPTIRTALLACALLISAPVMAQTATGATAAKAAAATAAEKAKSDKLKAEKAKADKAKNDKAKSEKAKAEKSKSAQANSAKDKDAKTKGAANKNDKAKNDKAKSDKAKSDKAKGVADKSAKSATATKAQPPRAPEPQATQVPAATAPAAAAAAESAPAAEADAGKSTARSAAAQVARDIAVKNWKPVNVPRPPVLDKALRIAAAKADKERGAKPAAVQAQTAQPKAAEAKQPASDAARAATAAAIAQAPAPPQPRATGIFALLTQGNPDPSASQQDSGAVVRVPSAASAFARPEGPATRVARLTPLTNPLRPKATPDTKDDDLEDEEEDAPVPGGLRKQVASVQTDCIQPQLLTMVQKAAEHFGGEAIITSGFRARGRRGSYHRRCAAVDFQITGVASSQLVAYLRKMPGAGGVGTYCHTKSVHLDTGTPRDWHQCAFHRRFALRSPIGE